MKSVVINHRDRDLFNYLYEVKVATEKQIRRDVYNEVTKTVVYRRLKKLLKAHYLKRFFFFDGKRTISAFSLSKSALRKFILGNQSDEEAVKRCFSDSIEHDIALGEIRHRFLKSPEMVDYFSENVLLSSASFVDGENFNPFKRLHTDGVAIVTKRNHHLYLAVEYEHTLKYTPRYERLLKDYKNEEKIHSLLYICRNNQVLRRIKKIVQGLKLESVFVITLDKIFDSSSPLEFVNCYDGSILSLA